VSIFSRHHHSRSGAFLRASVEYLCITRTNSFSSEVVTPELAWKKSFNRKGIKKRPSFEKYGRTDFTTKKHDVISAIRLYFVEFN